ncbi:MAG TPA: hypothetical protein PK961_03035 [bacterium]|nr:hypothetical protein [bacterium]
MKRPSVICFLIAMFSLVVFAGCNPSSDDDDNDDNDHADDDTTDDDAGDDDTTDDDDTGDDDTTDDDTGDDDMDDDTLVDDDTIDDDTGDDDVDDDTLVDDDTFVPTDEPEYQWIDGGLIQVNPIGMVRQSDGAMYVSGIRSGELFLFTKVGDDVTAEHIAAGVDDSALAADAAGNLHLAYHDLNNDDLVYAKQAAGGWLKWVIDHDGSVGSRPSLRIDAGGAAHIAYVKASAQQVKYATNASGDWVRRIIEENCGEIDSTSLALDGNDRLHLAYTIGEPRQLHYATNSGRAWTVETVSAAGVSTCSLALDSDGRPHISFLSALEANLRYARRTSSGWEVETVTPLFPGGDCSSLVLDENDHAHIAHQHWPSGNLCYSTNAGGEWASEVLAWHDGGWTTIALDDAGKLYIVDSADNFIGYTTNVSGEWTFGEYTRSFQAGRGLAAALDADARAHLAYVVETNTDALVYATGAAEAPIEPHHTFTDYSLAVDHTNTAALVVDDAGAVHVAYAKGVMTFANRYLVYATDATGAWVEEIVDQTGGTAGPAIAVHGGVVHLAYYRDASDQIVHAYGQPGAWTCEEIGAGFYDQGAFVAMVVTDDGAVHLAYFNGDLMHATDAGGSWASETVDDRVTSGRWATMAVDSAGHLHVVYNYDDRPYYAGLRYATDASGDWLTDTIDSTTDIDAFPSLAIDGDGAVHVVYRDSDGLLKYFIGGYGDWTSYPITKQMCVVGESSLAVGPDGLVRLFATGDLAVWVKKIDPDAR